MEIDGKNKMRDIGELKAVLFDLDGTLVNTMYSLQDTMNKVLKKFSVAPISEEQTMKFIGNGYHVFVERSLGAYADSLYKRAEKLEGKDPDKALELDQQADEVMGLYDAVCDEYIKLFAENCTYRTEAYPGMKETLNTLKERGFLIACVTNKSLKEAEKVLEHVFGAGVFSYVSADDGTHPLKPDIGVIQDVTNKLNVEPCQCIYVGDSRTDVETAKRAGIPCIGCCYGFRGRDELERYHADYLIDSADEILSIITDSYR